MTLAEAIDRKSNILKALLGGVSSLSDDEETMRDFSLILKL
jgi:hypothetical protein